MALGAIELIAEEQALLDTLKFDLDALDGHESFEANADRALALTKQLVARQGIPDHRRRYFVDPDYHLGGRGRSRLQIFERNGCRGDDILRHAHFLPYLHYFIYGPALPEVVLRAFEQAVRDCGMVTSSDVVPLGNFARKLTRDHGLSKHHASEEFFKLANELGVGMIAAASIHRSVMQLRK